MERRLNRDLFSLAQNRLTLLYACLMTLFLTLFIIIVYLLLTFIILSDQKDQLKSLVRQEAEVIENWMNDGGELSAVEMDNQRIRKSGNDIFFYYIVDEDGTLATGGELFRSMRSELLELVGGWTPEHTEIRSGRLDVEPETEANGADAGKLQGQPPDFISTSELRLMFAAKTIQTKDGTAGTLYLGINVTSRYNTFHWLLIVLIGLVLVFVLLAYSISRYMSRKAMVPAVESYTKQQQFLADASHELRTPLSVLLSSINALELEDGVGKQPFASATLDQMKEEVKRMAAMVSDLLLLARTDANELVFTKHMLDFKPLAEKTIQSMSLLAEQKKIGITLQSPPQAFISGDPERLRQVLYILLDNAIKYSPADSTVHVELSYSGPQRKRMLRLLVKDAGAGIAERDAERIFDRFYRADSSRHRQSSGHGLGLAIAKSIVTSHGGKISVMPRNDGPGSTFQVLLPAAGHAARR